MDLSRSLLWDGPDAWPRSLRNLAAERNGLLEDFSEAMYPIFDELWLRLLRADEWWDAFATPIGSSHSGDFWFAEFEIKDADTVTLWAEMNQVGFADQFEVLKGGIYQSMPDPTVMAPP